MIDNKDILDFIAICNRHGVRYILVGGYAVIHYTEPRYTKDVDFYVEATEETSGR